MATLAVDKIRNFETVGEILNDLPVIASDIIYEGAAIGQSGGNMRPLVGGDSFKGFAFRQADNSLGAAGAVNVKTRCRGFVELDVTGVTGVTNHGATVYATDDDTFTLSSTGGSSIGKVHRWISSTKCIVFFEDVTLRSL